MWVLIVVLAVVLLALAGFGLAMLVNGDRDTGGQSRPPSSSPAGSEENDGGAGAGAQPGNTPNPEHGQTKPSAPGRFVEVDESKFIGRSASYAAGTLEGEGLKPVVTARGGGPPNDRLGGWSKSI